MSNEESKLMWDLAFLFTIKHGGASGFKSFKVIRSFITHKNIFMAPGFGLGDRSVWNIAKREEFEYLVASRHHGDGFTSFIHRGFIAVEQLEDICHREILERLKSQK